MALIAVEEERFERLEKIVSDIHEKLSNQPSLFDDLIDAEQLRLKCGGPHPSTWWRWEKKGFLGNPIMLGTKKMYRLSEVVRQNSIKAKL